MGLGRVGIWWNGPKPAEFAAEVEELGYGAWWQSGAFEPGLASWFGDILAATRRIVVASGIITIWPNEPASLAAAVRDLDASYPGRFLLGLGASHARIVEASGERYQHPYRRMAGFLDGLDAEGPPVGPERRILAALGPRMLSLAGTRSLGAHPYFVPPEHMVTAREAIGPGKLLAAELAVVLETDPAAARETARSYAHRYLRLPNYTNNLRRLGYSDDDLAGAGSDRLIDAVIGWGDETGIARRVKAFHDAGADHVCIQVITRENDFPRDQYRRLAAALT